MTEVSFFVPGVPVGQGNHRTSASGHVYETTRGHKEWRDKVALHGCAARGVTTVAITGPVLVTAGFLFPRPKSHYRTGKYAHLLKWSAPYWHSIAPDGDKLARLVGDALTMAGVIKDDALIAQWTIGKWYSDTPGASISITTLEESLNYEGIHDYVHTDEDAPDESGSDLLQQIDQFQRWMNAFLESKGAEPVCVECSGTGAITIPCITCAP